MHVLVNILTSLLAIIALLAENLMGWGWLDPAMRIAGALVISPWAYRLMRDTSKIPLDRNDNSETIAQIIFNYRGRFRSPVL